MSEGEELAIQHLMSALQDLEALRAEFGDALIDKILSLSKPERQQAVLMKMIEESYSEVYNEAMNPVYKDVCSGVNVEQHRAEHGDEVIDQMIAMNDVIARRNVEQHRAKYGDGWIDHLLAKYPA